MSAQAQALSGTKAGTKAQASPTLNTAQMRAAVKAGQLLNEPLPPCEIACRSTRLFEAMTAAPNNISALIVTNLTNVRYLTGFTGSWGTVVADREAAQVTLIADPRYAERAADELRVAGAAAVDLRIIKADAYGKTLERLVRGRDRVALEGTTSWDSVASIEAALSKKQRVEIVRVSGLVEGLRRTKDAGELARLARAAAIADRAFMATLTVLTERGVTESGYRKSLEDAMDDRGSGGPSFATIVASGPNASRPHHDTGSRAIEAGDAVIVDFGATYDGYHSDMTRTVFVGEPRRAQRKHFDVVRAAQAAGASAVRHGVEASAVDAACRDIIGAAGWGPRFSHGTGHGVGLVIHEAPWVGRTSSGSLAAGDVVTVEPGVYLPGRGGVRIEDSLVVTRTGSLVLTGAPKDLVV